MCRHSSRMLSYAVQKVDEATMQQLTWDLRQMLLTVCVASAHIYSDLRRHVQTVSESLDRGLLVM